MSVRRSCSELYRRDAFFLHRLKSTFRGSNHEKVSCLWEETDYLETFLVACYPRKNLFLGKVAILSSSSVINWRLNITDPFVVNITIPMELGKRFKILLLNLGLFNSGLFDFFSFNKLIFLFLRQGSIL